jgi:hypothetical protein
MRFSCCVHVWLAPRAPTSTIGVSATGRRIAAAVVEGLPPGWTAKLDVIRTGQQACASANRTADHGAGEWIAQQGAGRRAGAGTEQAAGNRTITW